MFGYHYLWCWWKWVIIVLYTNEVISLKIKVISDLHLEFGSYNDIGSGDVLILAGDICVINDLIAEWMLHPHPENTFLNFFDECVKNYKKVFYVMGNHEHYGWDYKLSEMWLRKCLPVGITLLNNEVCNYEGINFIGTTLWAGYNNCEGLMSDFKQITVDDKPLTEEFLREENNKNIEFLKNTIPSLDNVVVISHHSPSMLSVDDSRKELGVSEGYANHLESFIEDNNQIQYWFHGHLHDSLNYNIGECNVICNPRGYVGHCVNNQLKQNLEVIM